jgi:Ca2+-binding RTX toxin-like protein
MSFISGSGILYSSNDPYDRIIGLSANDTVSYLYARAAVNVSLSLTGAQSTGGSGFDELISIESIIGSKHNDTLQGNSGNNTINGGLGSDTVSYSNAGAGVNVSLLLTSAQNTIGAGFDTLINLENLIGSSYADTLTGNAVSNVIIGGSGNDRLVGTSGSDILDGGSDSDIADYSGLRSVVTLGAFGVLRKGTLGTDTLINIETIVGSGAHGDTIDHSGIGAPATGTITDLTAGKVTVNGTSSPLPLTFSVSKFEHVIGSNFADTIAGNTDNNSLTAGAGNDTLIASGGNDTLNGGVGNDTASYSDLSSVVTLGAFGVLSKGTLGTDSLIGIETIIGSGAKGDTIDHSGIGAPATGTITDLAGGKVTVSGTTSPLPLTFIVSQFEHVIGSNFADKISGNADNNSLFASAGNDTLIASAGNDTLNGGTGNDTANYTDLSTVVTLGAFGVLSKGTMGTDSLIGIETIIGSGAKGDTIDHSSIGAPATGTITDLAAGKVTVNGSSAPLPLSFSISQFEHVIGSNFADSMSGNGDNNALFAGAGNDTLIASAGNDTLNGGTGLDTANYTDLGSVVTLAAFGVLTKGSLGTDALVGIESIIGSRGHGDTIDHSGIGAPATGTITDLAAGKVTVDGSSSPLPLKFSISEFEHVIGSNFADSITGNASNNNLSGGAGNDTVTGGDGYDTIVGGFGSDSITGGNGIDQYDYLSLSDSLLADYDIIIDYSLGEVINRPGSGQVINSSNGTASSLTASALSGLLNIFSFTGNSSAAFTVLNLSGTFIALNDATAGFNESTDSILYLPAYNINGINTVTIG